MQRMAMPSNRVSWIWPVSVLVIVSWMVDTAWSQFRDITPPATSRGSQARSARKVDPPPDPLPMADVKSEPRRQPEPVSELLPSADAETAPPAARGAVSRAGTATRRNLQLSKQISELIDKELIDDNQLRPIRFRGVLVGESTFDELVAQWGKPFKTVNSRGTRTVKFEVQPFRQVDVTIFDDRVTSILIHLFDMQEPGHVARELRMTKINPVPIPDEFGNVMGLSFPERGVLLGFDYRDPESLVAKILLEPINPEPFLLRAEYDFDHDYSQDLMDIQTALKLNPRYARAYALQAQRLTELGRYRDALESVERALDLDPEFTRCAVLRARLLEALGKYGPGRRQAEQVLNREELPPDERAQVELILGDILAQEKSDQFNRALRKHLKAIELAAPLANDPRFEIRRSAKRTLIDAHLAVARDIGLGNFQRQLEVVPKWIDRARALVEEYVTRDQGDRALRLVVANHTLAAAADLQIPDDPGRVIDDLVEEGRKQIALSEDAANQHRVEWFLATGLAEAVRLQRIRGETDEALDAADDALTLFQKSAPDRQSTPSQKYLVGRLYFHIGSLNAVQRKDHDEALSWYHKAQPMLSVSRPSPLLADVRTHGEAFVSMGVSYWETGDQEQAIELTELGTDILQKGVLSEICPPETLAIPYGNLASMHRIAGHTAEAKAFAELAESITADAPTQR